MTLSVQRVNAFEEPMQGIFLTLYNISGKKIVIGDQGPIIRITDRNGRAVFTDIPAGVYAIIERGCGDKLKVGIKRSRQKYPQAYPNRKQKKMGD